jgi:hypothetical protein
MVGGLLVACGAVLGVSGTWNAYRNARDSLVPFTSPGDPTRAAIDAARPLVARPKLRRAARHVSLAMGWLVAATYGLYLASAGLAVPA